MNRLLAHVAHAAMLLVVVGCAYQPVGSDQREQRVSPGNSERVLRVDGTSVILGDASDRSLTASALLDRVGVRLSVGDHNGAGDLMARFPDQAREALLDSDLARHSAAPAVAAWLDQQASPARGGWALLIDDRRRNPARYAEYDAQRRALWSAFRRGDFGSTRRSSLELPQDGPTPWPVIDSTILTATALLASGNPGDAAPLFEDAAESATPWDPAFADRQRLFAALSHRMAGRTAEAQRIEAQVTSLTPPQLEHIHDPMVLRLALKTVARNPSLSSGPDFSERMIHAQLGHVELQRGSPQSALLSYRAAESKPGLAPPTNRLRLKQAEALLALRQEQPAIVMLAGLAQGDTRPDALAMLGLIHLRRNEIGTGMAMLEEAVRLTTAESHPQIHADAGLSLLSAGQREPGLRLLHRSRDEFKKRGDLSAVRRSLMNELQFARAQGDDDLIQQVRGELAALGSER